MNLVMGLLWLAGGVAVFAYEFATGSMPLRLRGLNVSIGWLFLVLALYNFARWYSRVSRPSDKTLNFLAEARLRQSQRRERPEPDPNFDFTTPPAAPRPPSPPSEN